MPIFLPSLIAVLCWGAMFTVSEGAVAQLDAAHVTSIRYAVASVLFLGLLAAVEGRGALRYDGRLGRTFVLGSAGFAGFNLLSFAGLPHTTPEHAALVVATMPVLTILARWRMAGERPRPAVLAAVGAALAGVALVITAGDPAALLEGGVGLGELLVLLGAICWVRYTLGAQETPEWSPLRYTALSAAAGTATILALTAAGDLTGVLSLPAADDVAAFAPELGYVVVFGAVVAVLAWNAGVRRLGPANAALFMNLVPVTAFAIEALRGTTPGPVELAGATLTLGALVAANLVSRPRAPQPEPAPYPLLAVRRTASTMS